MSFFVGKQKTIPSDLKTIYLPLSSVAHGPGRKEVEICIAPTGSAETLWSQLASLHRNYRYRRDKLASTTVKP